MKTIDRNDISLLPFHDSDFNGLKILQTDNGETDIIIKMSFYKEDLEGLGIEYLKFIKTDGSAAILFKSCRWVNMNVICNSVHKDQIDFIGFKDDSKDLNRAKKHVEVIFISGSKMECYCDHIGLMEA